jgi:hypothetical protein
MIVTTHADVLLEDDTAYLLLLPEELVQNPRKMMGAKRLTYKRVIRHTVAGSETSDFETEAEIS